MSMLPALAPISPVAQAYGRVGDVLDLTPILCATASVEAAGTLIRDTPRTAARLIAGWLSTQEAIWWGALCQSQLLDLSLGKPDSVLLKAIFVWTRDPGDNTRLAVEQANTAPSTALGILAKAVAFTTDNMSPAAKTPIACPAGVAHRMVALSVLAGAELWPSSNRPPCLAHFLELGLDVSEGKLHWSGSGQAIRRGLRPLPQASTGHKRLHNIWENW